MSALWRAYAGARQRMRRFGVQGAGAEFCVAGGARRMCGAALAAGWRGSDKGTAVVLVDVHARANGEAATAGRAPSVCDQYERSALLQAPGGARGGHRRLCYRATTGNRGCSWPQAALLYTLVGMVPDRLLEARAATGGPRSGRCSWIQRLELMSDSRWHLR